MALFNCFTYLESKQSQCADRNIATTLLQVPECFCSGITEQMTIRYFPKMFHVPFDLFDVSPIAMHQRKLVTLP